LTEGLELIKISIILNGNFNPKIPVMKSTYDKIFKKNISFLPGRFHNYAQVGETGVVSHSDQTFRDVCHSEDLLFSQFSEYKL
jgi:hypothetical protein